MRVVVAAVVLAIGGSVVTPAWACACGGYLPDAVSAAQQRARVAGETALVRHDGRREEIVLSMAVLGRSKKAAWIMPVPSQATVELGNEGLFGRLEYQTRPRYEYRKTYWPFRDLGVMGSGDAAGAPQRSGVDVRQQMRLGPFEVARLGAASGTAVESWLTANGYLVPSGLAENVQPYVDERWELIAVKLAPEEAAGELSGATPPLRLSFASDRIVYPMRMSKAATTEQTVVVYVAAPFRVRPETLPDPAVQPELLYAGRPDTGAEVPQLDSRTPYLTAFSVRYGDPARIANDFTFAKAPTDDEFRRVVVVTRNEGWLTTLAILIGAPLLFGVGLAVLSLRLTRSRRRRGA